MVRWGGGAGRCGFTQRFSITDRAIGVAAVQDVLAIDDIEPACDDYGCADPDRSEEHTSELQSLMRISYAVFCLKKKKSVERWRHLQHQRRRRRQRISAVAPSTSVH